MDLWVWICIGLLFVSFILLLWGLMAASGKYNRRVEEYEYNRMMETKGKEENRK